jgi:hypothetical protein
MSQGQETQSKINIWMAVTIAAAVFQILMLFALRTTRNPAVWIMLGVVIVLATLGQLAHRCRECKYDVTKDAEGVRVNKGWPKVNENCANCGADIP